MALLWPCTLQGSNKIEPKMASAESLRGVFMLAVLLESLNYIDDITFKGEPSPERVATPEPEIFRERIFSTAKNPLRITLTSLQLSGLQNDILVGLFLPFECVQSPFELGYFKSAKKSGSQIADRIGQFGVQFSGSYLND